MSSFTYVPRPSKFVFLPGATRRLKKRIRTKEKSGIRREKARREKAFRVERARRDGLLWEGHHDD